jgi:hypothetical protein
MPQTRPGASTWRRASLRLRGGLPLGSGLICAWRPMPDSLPACLGTGGHDGVRAGGPRRSLAQAEEAGLLSFLVTRGGESRVVRR